jgi:hypothetical protein
LSRHTDCGNTNSTSASGKEKSSDYGKSIREEKGLVGLEPTTLGSENDAKQLPFVKNDYGGRKTLTLIGSGGTRTLNPTKSG